MRTRVKVCGITRGEDGVAAAKLGVDAVGLVFYEQSPRCVDIEKAREIVGRLPAFVSVVGLFVNPDVSLVRQVLDMVKVTTLQFHGDETEDFCAQFGVPYLKAIRVKGAESLERIGDYSSAQAILLDGFHPSQYGGSGQTFDWSLIPRNFERSIILAGGLSAENVRQAIGGVRPFAVDVSSGVESAPGCKDEELMEQFIQAVYEADKN